MFEPDKRYQFNFLSSLEAGVVDKGHSTGVVIEETLPLIKVRLDGGAETIINTSSNLFIDAVLLHR